MSTEIDSVDIKDASGRVLFMTDSTGRIFATTKTVEMPYRCKCSCGRYCYDDTGYYSAECFNKEEENVVY